MTAAELSSALVAFDEAMLNGQWHSELKGARKEIVLSLGNVTDCALRMQEFEKAYNFAKATLHALEELKARPGDKQVDEGIETKNQNWLHVAAGQIDPLKPPKTWLAARVNTLIIDPLD